MFINGLDKESIVLYAARASRVENQDAIDACMVGMLADPKEVYINGDLVICTYKPTYCSPFKLT